VYSEPSGYGYPQYSSAGPKKYNDQFNQSESSDRYGPYAQGAN